MYNENLYKIAILTKWLLDVIVVAIRRKDMPNIGVKELRDHLSSYINKVKAGEIVIVTDRGKAVASIIPIDKEEMTKEILPLIKKGFITWRGGKPKGNPNSPVIKGRPTSKIVLEGRR